MVEWLDGFVVVNGEVKPGIRSPEVYFGQTIYSPVFGWINWSVIVIFPMVWVLVSAFKTDKEIFFSPWLPPAQPQWDNFARAWGKANMGLYLLNSLIVALGTSVIAVILGSSAAYAFSRFQFIGRQFGMLGFIILLMLPASATLAPLFVLLSQIKIGLNPVNYLPKISNTIHRNAPKRSSGISLRGNH